MVLFDSVARVEDAPQFHLKRFSGILVNANVDSGTAVRRAVFFFGSTAKFCAGRRSLSGLGVDRNECPAGWEAPELGVRLLSLVVSSSLHITS